MNAPAKLLIAYDGSECSIAAVNDLKRAGLPARAEAVVVTLADVFAPPEDEIPDDELVSRVAAEMVKPSQAHATEAIKQALAVAQQGADRVKTLFPAWTVRTQADGDSPAWGVIKMARPDTDLIVLGSQRHFSAWGRLILGSVSQRVLYEADCSVRVSRCSEEQREGPVRIVVGFADSEDSLAAIEAVAAREWPEGSELRLVTARDKLEPNESRLHVEKLRASGLKLQEVYREGDPSHILINEAEDWGADSIFVGTRNLHGLRHLLQGSVSSVVAAHAQCSVEVVRPNRGAA